MLLYFSDLHIDLCNDELNVVVACLYANLRDPSADLSVLETRMTGVLRICGRSLGSLRRNLIIVDAHEFA